MAPILDLATGMLWVAVLTNIGSGPGHQVLELEASAGQVERRQDIPMPGRLAAAE